MTTQLVPVLVEIRHSTKDLANHSPKANADLSVVGDTW